MIFEPDNNHIEVYAFSKENISLARILNKILAYLKLKNKRISDNNIVLKKMENFREQSEGYIKVESGVYDSFKDVTEESETRTQYILSSAQVYTILPKIIPDNYEVKAFRLFLAYHCKRSRMFLIVK